MSPCLFCRIVQRQLPADVVAEEEKMLAFKDINPQAPTHLLVIPKAHIAKVSELTDANRSVMTDLIAMANRLARQQGVVDSGYRLVINCGPQAGQSVDHLHLHMLGGRPMKWPPG